MAKEIVLTQGMVAIVDDEDYERLLTYKWSVTSSKGSKTFYARTAIYPKDVIGIRGKLRHSKQVQIKMHRIIMNAPEGIKVDHRDGDGLNNQKYNLRLATQKQNSANMTKFKRVCVSKHKGVGLITSEYPLAKPWRAYININRKQVHLGTYATELEAAEAYNVKAVESFGEFAKLNTLLLPKLLPEKKSGLTECL